jgi:regulator of sigma E protease
MGVLVQVTQFILSLSILIVLHEAGHFFSARLFKIRVEKFYLFFDPWISLFKVKRGDTEYGIGWLPLGGYVKISGMIDESMDKEQMKQPPQPWEFRSKPAWQRLIVMIAGVTVNLILGVAIYSMVIYTWGTEYLPNANVKYGISCDSLALKMGLRNGDKIISVDNKVIDDFGKIPQEITLHKAHSIQVMRNGTQQNVVVSEDDISQILKDPKGFIAPLIPCQVDSVVPNSGASKVGLKKGDVITRIDSTSVAYYQDISPIFEKDSGKDVQLTIKSGDQIRVATAHIDKDGKLGFMNKSPLDFLQTVKASYSFFGSIPAGINMGVEKIKDYAQSLNVLFTVKGAYKQMGGFITIGKAYAKEWDWERFWSFTAFLSIILAFMNILPIPALDGGHVLFLLYEMATGRKPSEKFMEYAQYTGMLILLTLMVFANGNDIIKLFHK